MNPNKVPDFGRGPKKKAGQRPRLGSQYDLLLKNLNPIRRIRELTLEPGRTRRERDLARQEAERLQREWERVQEGNQRLHKELEAAPRAARRQAAPCSRGGRKSAPQPPGRQPGAAYGRHYQRPTPDHLDEEIQVATPQPGAACGGRLTVERVTCRIRRKWYAAVGYEASTFPSADGNGVVSR